MTNAVEMQKKKMEESIQAEQKAQAKAGRLIPL